MILIITLSYYLEFLIVFTSTFFIIPESHFSIDLNTGSLKNLEPPPTKKENKIKINKRSKGNINNIDTFNFSKYSIITEHSLSLDGTRVPLTIVFDNKNGTLKSPSNDPTKMVLIGYGTYGVSLSVQYDPQVRVSDKARIELITRSVTHPLSY
jgi:protease II